MPTSSPEKENSFSTTLPLLVLQRPLNPPNTDWQEVDRGPGIFKIPAGYEACVRVRTFNDDTLQQLVKEIIGCLTITALNLSENRNISDAGLAYLAGFHQLTDLNLSSCTISDHGLEYLLPLTGLTRLNLSYCNRITDAGLKRLNSLRHLVYLDLQGCVKISNGGISKLRRQGLMIHVR